MGAALRVDGVQSLVEFFERGAPRRGVEANLRDVDEVQQRIAIAFAQFVHLKSAYGALTVVQERQGIDGIHG